MPHDRHRARRGLFWSLVAYRLFHGKKMVLFELVPDSSGAGGPVTSRG
ncbi:MAG TPA: hypothetical protein VFX88_14085 [Actinomycetota bacterium]|nr:hypothetical protein [Actinomycetota bacterium]